MEASLLEQIYKKYGRRVYLYIYSLCRNQAVAEDILQEVFLKAFLALTPEHGNMKAWLYMVARNLVFNAGKKSSKECLSEEPWILSSGYAQQKDGLYYVLRNEKYSHLYACIDRLPERKKEILMLQYFGDLSIREIAAIMHLSQENVRVLSHRAKKELKIMMEVNGYEI